MPGVFITKLAADPAFRELRAMAGRPLPNYIEEEFDAHLKCGRMEEGFLRLRCSCSARRMAETTVLLAEEALPERPLRQWVLSLPIALRFLMVYQPRRALAGSSLEINAVRNFRNDPTAGADCNSFSCCRV